MIAAAPARRRPGRYASPDAVTQAILQRRRCGLPINYGAVLTEDRFLAAAAKRHFSNWSVALRACGLDPASIVLYRQWTPQTIVNAIRDLAGRGEPVHYKRVFHIDAGLLQAASHAFGSWDAALTAAGLDPRRVRRARKPWTKSELLELIVRQIDAGRPVTKYNLRPISASLAIPRLFGSLRNALRQAGVLHAVRPLRQWSRSDVIHAIRDRHHRGLPLNNRAVLSADARLQRQAKRFFGTWRSALEAAGFVPRDIELIRPKWTAARLLAEIRRLAAAGEMDVVDARFTCGFVMAAKRLFGSVDLAVQAAIGRPRVRPQPWTADRVVRTVRELAASGRPVNATAVDSQLLYAAYRKLGSWDAALVGAGLDPQRVHRNCSPWVPETIQSEIARRFDSGESLKATLVRPSLYLRAKFFYGSWPNALAAAGMTVTRDNHGAYVVTRQASRPGDHS